MLFEIMEAHRHVENLHIIIIILILIKIFCNKENETKIKNKLK